MPDINPRTKSELLNDPLLSALPEVEGFKVLEPVILLAKIGEGGMGAVYQGTHMSLDIDVALKCLRQDLAAQDLEFVDRFKREAKIAASVNSPHLIRVYDVNQSHGLHYLIMEFVRGESAKERVERKGRLGLQEAITIVRCAAVGLSAAHGLGIVHRDIKPENIMISSLGEVKVADLGLAKAGDDLDNVKTQTGMLMGTPKYMPPEQYADAHGVGPEGDVYSLAATLYFLLAGENAIQSGTLVEVMNRVCNHDFPDIRQKRPEVPDALADLIAAATKKNPDERLGSCLDFAEALSEFLTCPLSDSSSVLRDKDAAATQSVNCNTVSAPPEQTVARIRVALASDQLDVGSNSVTVQPSKNQHSATVLASFHQKTQGQNRASYVSVSRKRQPWPIIGFAVFGLILLAAGIPLFNYLLDSENDHESVEISDSVLGPVVTVNQDVAHDDGVDDAMEPEPMFRSKGRPKSARTVVSIPKDERGGRLVRQQDQVPKKRALPPRKPDLILDRPPRDLEAHDVFLHGTVRHDRDVTVHADGRIWPTDSQGRFEIKIALKMGANRIVVVAKDQDGNDARREVVVHRHPPSQEPPLGQPRDQGPDRRRPPMPQLQGQGSPPRNRGPINRRPPRRRRKN